MQPGLCGTWSEISKTGFLTTRLISEHNMQLICSFPIFDHFVSQWDYNSCNKLYLNISGENVLWCLSFVYICLSDSTFYLRIEESDIYEGCTRNSWKGIRERRPLQVAEWYFTISMQCLCQSDTRIIKDFDPAFS